MYIYVISSLEAEKIKNSNRNISGDHKFLYSCLPGRVCTFCTLETTAWRTIDTSWLRKCLAQARTSWSSNPPTAYRWARTGSCLRFDVGLVLAWWWLGNTYNISYIKNVYSKSDGRAQFGMICVCLVLFWNGLLSAAVGQTSQYVPKTTDRMNDCMRRLNLVLPDLVRCWCHFQLALHQSHHALESIRF